MNRMQLIQTNEITKLNQRRKSLKLYLQAVKIFVIQLLTKKEPGLFLIPKPKTKMKFFVTQLLVKKQLGIFLIIKPKMIQTLLIHLLIKKFLPKKLLMGLYGKHWTKTETQVDHRFIQYSKTFLVQLPMLKGILCSVRQVAHSI